jgi:hypothetical protein
VLVARGTSKPSRDRARDVGERRQPVSRTLSTVDLNNDVVALAEREEEIHLPARATDVQAPGTSWTG